MEELAEKERVEEMDMPQKQVDITDLDDKQLTEIFRSFFPQLNAVLNEMKERDFKIILSMVKNNDRKEVVSNLFDLQDYLFGIERVYRDM